MQRMLRCCIDASTPVPDRDKAQNYQCDYADDELITAVMTWWHLLHFDASAAYVALATFGGWFPFTKALVEFGLQ
jgi:hypothetical protein